MGGELRAPEYVWRARIASWIGGPLALSVGPMEGSEGHGEDAAREPKDESQMQVKGGLEGRRRRGLEVAERGLECHGR